MIQVSNMGIWDEQIENPKVHACFLKQIIASMNP